MATTLKIVAQNTAPAWQITCERAGVPINLTGCAISVIIAKGSTVTNYGGTCTVTDATKGVVSYVPKATDCPSSGTYKVDVKIVYADFSYEILYEQLKVKTRAPIVPE